MEREGGLDHVKCKRDREKECQRNKERERKWNSDKWRDMAREEESRREGKNLGVSGVRESGRPHKI